MQIEGLDVLENLFNYACKQDRNAVEYCFAVWRICHFWDDLKDNDPVSDEETNRALSTLMVDINRNPFYRQNVDVLTGLLSQIIANWHVANTYESKKTNLDIL